MVSLTELMFGRSPRMPNPADVLSVTGETVQVRQQFVTECVWDGQSERIRITGVRNIGGRSRGKGGKQAHRFTGIAAARRAARKGR